MPGEDECQSMKDDISELKDTTEEHKKILHQHNAKFDKHDRTEARRSELLELNTKAINKLCENTNGLVETWNTIGSLAKFVKWFSAFVLAIGTIVGAFLYFT